MEKQHVVFKLLIRVALCLVLCSFAHGCTSVEKKVFLPVYIEKSTGEFKITKGFKSYSLFFATSYYPTDVVSGKSKDRLKRQFKRFAKSIGKDNAAIWVKRPDSDDLNVELGKTYSDRLYEWHRLKLDYSDGPYLVYLTHNPDYPPQIDDFAVAISFSNKSQEHIIEAIEYLEAQIRRNEVSKHETFVIDYWLDLKSFLAKNVVFIKEIIIAVSEKSL